MTSYTDLAVLAIHPAYQRRGLGTLLINSGLSIANAAGARTYIQSSKVGLALYKHHGSRGIDEVTLEGKGYGQDDIVEKYLVKELSDREKACTQLDSQR